MEETYGLMQQTISSSNELLFARGDGGEVEPVPSPFSATETDALHYVTLIASGLSTL